MRNFGRYAIEALVGQGPVASVYRAGDGSGTVALKVLHPQLASDETIRERFRREALEARALKHPGIAQTYDVAESEGLLAAVGEYCPGGSIEGWKAGSAEELEAFARQAAAALDYAHSLGAVHRNLKPSNVLRGADGSFKLADFGSGRLSDLVGLTATTAFLGSPQFVAPESLDRPYPDPRWDLYSLGACLYLAATGKSHAGRSMESLFNPERGFRRPALLEPSLPAYLDAIIVSLLGPLPGRPRTAAELLALLRERGTAAAPEKECLYCAASMPEASTVCPACLRSEPDLSDRPGPEAQAVLVTRVSEDSAALKELGRIVKILSGDPARSLRFMTEDARMYSKAERERYASMPCRLVERISPESASLVAALIEERTGGKVKAKALPMARALRLSRRGIRRSGTANRFLPGLSYALRASKASLPALVSPAPRFLPEQGPASVQETAFERKALESMGVPAPATEGGAAPPGSAMDRPAAGPSAGAGNSADAGNSARAAASLRRSEGADLVLAARRALGRALSLGGEADAFKARLMDIVMKAAALMDELGRIQARLDSVSLASLYASMKRLEDAAAESRDSDETEGILREKARIFEAYQEFKELERDACLLNRRLLCAASALDGMARAGAGGLSPESLEEVSRMLEG